MFISGEVTIKLSDFEMLKTMSKQGEDNSKKLEILSSEIKDLKTYLSSKDFEMKHFIMNSISNIENLLGR